MTTKALPERPIAELAAELTSLDEAVHVGNLGRGAELYTAGEPADRVYVLRSGSAKTSIDGPGGKHCLFQIVEAGEVFGEEGVLGQGVRSSSAMILDTASITMLPTRAVRGWLDRRPEAWAALVALLQQRVRGLEEQLQWVSFLEVEQRVARLLLRWTRRQPTDGVELHLSQRDLAGLIGATRETTSSALNRLQRDGCIDIRRRCVAVRSHALLRRHAGPLQHGPDYSPSADLAFVDIVGG
jgi:CRP/FNR family transcriptional regulator, cyclic AMP receptor protein